MRKNMTGLAELRSESLAHTSTESAEEVTLQSDYKLQELPQYRGNPFIEVLPEILDKATFYSAAKRQPQYEEEFRKAADHLRRHMLGQIFDLFVPLPRHYTEKTVLDRLIRRGYQTRNPVSPDFWKSLSGSMDRVREDVKLLRTVTPLDLSYLGCSSDLNTLKMGISGSGKTTSSEISLRMYPQVFRHGMYFGCSLKRTQVVWLRLQAPYHGSVKDLCRAFFREIDRLLGTEYTLFFGKGDAESMLDQMIRIAAIHGLGLLVIDEVQEFSISKSGGKDALVGFLLRLTNTIGIPVLFIGTYKATKVLFSQMRHIRRTTGIGMPDWGPLEHSTDEWCTSPKKTEWSLFVNELWKLQFTRTPVPLTKDLSNALFDECQGIPDFAKKVYFLVQDRLIATREKGGKELITVSAIQSVSRDYLKPAREILRALRENNRDVLDKLDDVELPSVEDYRGGDVVQLYVGAEQPSQAPTAPAEAPKNETRRTEALGMKVAPRSMSPTSERSKIAEVVGDGIADPEKAYQNLAGAGIIKSGVEFWK
jgi:hypothetical protein